MTGEVLDKLIICDAAGFLITEGESAEDFFQRIDDTAAVYDQFEAELSGGKKVKVFDLFEVSADCRISPELSEEAADITENLYGFAVHHVPGFYLTRQIGLLWGGCLIGDPEQNFAVFLLRNAFREKRRFLNYRREELLAHELCHSVRHVMNEPRLEEYFAYQTSPSPLRRYLGNCFISDKDAWGFLLPVMLLPIAELVRALLLPGFPSWIFWITALIYPVFLLWRNFCSRKLVNSARRILKSAGVAKCEAVLFRSLPEELAEIGRCKAEDFEEYALHKAETNLRWQVIYERFIRRTASETCEEKDL